MDCCELTVIRVAALAQEGPDGALTIAADRRVTYTFWGSRNMNEVTEYPQSQVAEILQNYVNRSIGVDDIEVCFTYWTLGKESL